MRISKRGKPDGLFSIARLPTWEPRDMRLTRTSLIMVADSMEIPGNLGTLIRKLDAAGADCLMLTNRRIRLTHPKMFGQIRIWFSWCPGWSSSARKTRLRGFGHII